MTSKLCADSAAQAQIELAVLEALTIKLRNGMLNAHVPRPGGKVFHVRDSVDTTHRTQVLADGALPGF